VGYSQKKIVPRMKDYEDDGSWMWVAFAPECRLIVAFVIGPRKQYVADELLKLTAKRLSELRPLFVSDGLKFYTKALLNEFGEIEEFPRTGKRGRPRNPKTIPPEDLEYAQVIKKRKGGRLQKIVKKVIFGKSIEEKEISTSLLERQNLTFRQDNNRVSRRTIGFSKKVECLISRMMLYCTHFNFCREHSGLAYEDERGIKCKNTPAREAKITESKWKLRDLMTFRYFKTSTG
jgi:IS1 family transposase